MFCSSDWSRLPTLTLHQEMQDGGPSPPTKDHIEDNHWCYVELWWGGGTSCVKFQQFCSVFVTSQSHLLNSHFEYCLLLLHQKNTVAGAHFLLELLIKNNKNWCNRL